MLSFNLHKTMREEYFTLYSDWEIEVLINKHETQDYTAIYFNDKSTLFQNSLSYLLCHPLKKNIVPVLVGVTI